MSILINAYCTTVEPPPIHSSHTLNSHRDLSDTELPEHLNGFIGYVLSRGDQKMTAIRYHVMQHIQRVRHQFSLNVQQSDLDSFSGWAWESNSILFLPDGTIRDPNGNILIQPDESEPNEDAVVPYPDDSIKRKENSNQNLQQHLVPIAKFLPPVIGLTETIPRNAESVACRALALFVVAVYAESIATNDPFSITELKAKRPIGFQHLTPNERAFIETSSPLEETVINFSWRYEALQLLLWSLKTIQELPYPSAICDVPLLAKTLLSIDESDYIANANLRHTEELLDALDFHYRLHWAAVDARVNKQSELAGIDEGVIRERHYALNWLLHFQNFNKDWDDIETPT